MLPKMPQPVVVEIVNTASVEATAASPEVEAASLPTETSHPPADSLKDLLLSPSDTSPPPAVPASSTTSSIRRALQSSSAVNDELAAQLAQMATQMKRNALHFSDVMIKDKAVVEEAQEKLEKNHGFMQQERTRLRDHSGKSTGTTWLMLGSFVIVLVSFMIMFFVIRLT